LDGDGVLDAILGRGTGHGGAGGMTWYKISNNNDLTSPWTKYNVAGDGMFISTFYRAFLLFLSFNNKNKKAKKKN
jgi:hypothetical protein